MAADRSTRALRRAVLELSLRDDAVLTSIETDNAGTTVEGFGARLTVPWDELTLASGDPRELLPPAALARRVRRWLRLRVLLESRVGAAAPEGPDAGRAWVLSRIRPRALPPDHDVHPGPSWPYGHVLGGALDRGLGLRGVTDDGALDPEAVGVLPLGLLTAAGIERDEAVARAERYLDDMGELAADRVRRDPMGTLRPLGDADVLTLLASARLRAALVIGPGMRSAAVPSRERGWLDLGRLDPAFAISAALLTEPDDRGFPRPILITADEVVLARAGGNAVAQALADPAPAERTYPATRLA